MKFKKFFYLLIFFIFLISLNFYVVTTLSKSNNFLVHKVKSLLPQSSRDFLKQFNSKIKNTLFVFENNNKLNKKIEEKNIKIFDILDSIHSFEFNLDSEELIQNEQYKLSKYTNSLLTEMGPRSYLEIYENKIILITGTGTIIYTNINNFNKKNLSFKKIETNFNQIVMSKYKDGRKSVIKNILIDQGIIYVSYLKLINKSCAKLAILSSKFNFEKLNFTEFFEIDNCQPYGGQMIQTGGNLSSYKDDKIIMTVGDFSSYEVQKNKNPQELDNMMGKILSINKVNKKANILSLGHRNSQGLFYDSRDDVIYSTDHGPFGGDEINVDFTHDHQNPKNFGWAVSSYGEHYSYEKKWLTEDLYKRAPLNKSHADFGFVEPIKYFTPSIGITQILRTEKFENILDKKVIYVGSMGWDLDENDLSIHKFILNNDYKIEKHEIIPIIERIRDLIYEKKTNKLVMFLETSGSIGILEKIN